MNDCTNYKHLSADMQSDAPVSIQQRLGETLSASLVEPLTTARTLQHLQVPPAAPQGDKCPTRE